jgi:hypothetical protein
LYGEGVTITLKDWVLPFQAAERLVGLLFETSAPVAMKVAEICPGAMLTEEGMIRPLPDVESSTVAVVSARGLLIFTVQVVVPPAAMVDGEQVSPDRPT